MSDNQSPVVSSSNTKYISIIPENGEVFNPEQKIIYNIEPNLGYIKRDTYLMFDVLNTSTNRACVAFPQQVGAHALIDNIRIYSKQTGVLLEALDNYSQICALVNQYSYDDKTQLQMKEGVGHPATSMLNTIDGNAVFATSRMLTAGHHISNFQLSPISNTPATGTAKYTSRRFCIPLRAGIFRAFDDERLIPVLNMGGLRIEINLNPANLALNRIAPAAVNTASPYGHDFVDLLNNGALVNARGGGDTDFVLTGSYSADKLGLVVGNSIRVGNTGGGGITRTIQAIADNGAGQVTLTLTGANIGATNNTARLYTSLGADANNGDGRSIDAMNYQITNTEMRVAVVAPNPQQAKDLMKELTYEFTSYDVFLDNIDAGTLRHQIPINSVSSKALGIVNLLYNADNERNNASQSYYTGATPSTNNVNSIQFFINNKLYPLRDYNPNRVADRVLTLNENVKCLKSIGIVPKHLGANEYGMVEDYNNTPLICRELARNGFVFDLRNAEGELRLGFGAVRTFRLRSNTFVFSKKVVETSPAGVQVVL